MHAGGRRPNADVLPEGSSPVFVRRAGRLQARAGSAAVRSRCAAPRAVTHGRKASFNFVLLLACLLGWSASAKSGRGCSGRRSCSAKRWIVVTLVYAWVLSVGPLHCLVRFRLCSRSGMVVATVDYLLLDAAPGLYGCLRSALFKWSHNRSSFHQSFVLLSCRNVQTTLSATRSCVDQRSFLIFAVGSNGNGPASPIESRRSFSSGLTVLDGSAAPNETR